MVYDVSKVELESELDTYLAWCFDHESPPLVGDLAMKLHVEPWQLGRAVKRHFGISVHEYFKQAQIEHAKQLLRDLRIHLNGVAYRCGFVTRATFFRVFRERTGLTPATFRRRYAANVVSA